MSHADIIQIIINTLLLPDDYVIEPDTEISNIPGWDSMAWIIIISEIELSAKKSFPLHRIDSISSISELVSAINSEGGNS